jgi:hypothetical protein
MHTNNMIVAMATASNTLVFVCKTRIVSNPRGERANCQWPNNCANNKAKCEKIYEKIRNI